MYGKKVLILPVSLSIVSHVLFLSATGLFDMRFLKVTPETTIWVNLPEAGPIQEEMEKRAAAGAHPMPPPEEIISGNDDEYKEETVDLDSPDQRFFPYLLKVKQRINRIWSYPPQAFTQRKEGTSTVQFSLDSNGILVASKIVVPSGSEVLDRETINVVKAASPYAPFPEDFDISRLHITATFQYRFVK